MTDINELTAKLKAAAIYEQLHTFMAVKPGDILALTEALEAAQSRIVSLEARTLTVKLPHWSGYTCSGEGAMLDACIRSLESQGFTVQIEGE